MRRKVLIAVLIAGALGAAGWYWLGTNRGPNLLVITLDTTRADHLGCYGYELAKTPVLDALAKEGVLCERAHTVAPITLPAHTSLFTGLYPAETGVRTNGRGGLSRSIDTLASVLKRRGYDTGAFVAAFVLNRKFGLNQGFDLYGDESGSTTDPAQRRQAESVIDSALAWLSRSRRQPFFCWVHLFDPHLPYAGHADLFGNEFAERPYDGEIAYVDRQVGRLVSFLKTRNLDENTLVVVTADHGEGLGEHGERSHLFLLYQTTMHVPLIFRQPGKLPAGGRVASRVSLVDVSPTILDVLGVPDPRKVTGRSFSQAFSGKDVPASPCYAITDEPYSLSNCAPLRSLIDGDWKYIQTTRPELYRLSDDPRETQNLAAQNPDKLLEMENLLSELEAKLVYRQAAGAAISAAERSNLKSDGYVGGSMFSRERPLPPDLLDIKDVLPYNDQVDDANHLVDSGNVESGIRQLQDVIQKAPKHTWAHLSLAFAYGRQKQPAQAILALQKLLDFAPDCADGHAEMGIALIELGRFADAIPELAQALRLDPSNVEAREYLEQARLRMSGR